MTDTNVQKKDGISLSPNSLQTRVLIATLMGALLLGLVALVVGLTMYTYSLVDEYISESFGLAKSTAVIIEHWIDEDVIARDVKEIYESLSESERANTGTAEYRARFAQVTDSRSFHYLNRILKDMRENSEVSDVYFAFFDAERQALVYICDPDESEQSKFYTGEWESISKREIDKFINWDGKDELYDISDEEPYGWMCTSGVPLTNSDGEITGYILADITLDDIIIGIKKFLLRYGIAMVCVVALVAYLMVRRMKTTLIKPINAIAKAAVDYVDDRRNGITANNHFSEMKIDTGDEIQNLSLVMAAMERDIAEYEESLTQAVAEKERIDTELSLAKRIQAEMLPSVFPPYPERTDLDIYATMDPAKEVGGDFYDFFLLDQDHLGLVIADVSGKGIPAALFMMITMTLVKNFALTGMSPAEVLDMLNRQICANNKEQMFVTMWFGILDLRDGRLIASNAGHEYPVLKKPGGRFEICKDHHCFVIGGMDGVKYSEYELHLEKGTRLFIYTDGIPEATNDQKEMFGIDRMLKALNQGAQDSAQATLETVRKYVDRFVGNAPQFDDMTMLCIEYIGPDHEGGAS